MTEPSFSQYEATNGTAEPVEVWRNEVQDRLERYKKRRGRRIEGAFTMRFPFPVEELPPAPPEEEVVSAPELVLEAAPEFEPPIAAVEPEVEVAASPAPEEVALAEGVELTASQDRVPPAPPTIFEDDALFVDPTPRPRPKRKVIAFPRQATVSPEPVHRLADPVTPDVPRILDVPEELEAIPATPFLDGLQFDQPDAQAVAIAREHVELPFVAASLSQRVFAGAVDLGITGVSVALFAAIAYKLLDHPAMGKLLVLGLLVSAVVLWSAYQYLFTVYAGRTMGMMAAHLRLVTFAGKSAGVRVRRNRVLGFYLSALSLGMGLMWSLVDVDHLCWHDRLSSSFLSSNN